MQFHSKKQPMLWLCTYFFYIPGGILNGEWYIRCIPMYVVWSIKLSQIISILEKLVGKMSIWRFAASSSCACRHGVRQRKWQRDTMGMWPPHRSGRTRCHDLPEQEVGVEALLPCEVGKWVCEPRWYLAMRWFPRTNLIWTVQSVCLQSARQIEEADVLLFTLYLYPSAVMNELMIPLSSLDGFVPHPAWNEVFDLTSAKRTHTPFPLLPFTVRGKPMLAQLGSERFADFFWMDGCVTVTVDWWIGFQAFGVTKLVSIPRRFFAGVFKKN
jgi:hypothetical protein